MGKEDPALVAAEKQRRFDLLDELVGSDNGAPLGVPTKRVNELRIFYGGRGIWFHKTVTSQVADPGVTVGLLHTGRNYDDDLGPSSIVYHYPVTKNPGTDHSEVTATRNAMVLEVPLFVVVDRGKKRDVHLGWVLDDDPLQQEFLVVFAGPAGPKPRPNIADEDFNPIAQKEWRTRKSKQRPNQARFSFEVKKEYGSACAACGLAVSELIEAAHIVPDSLHGSDDHRNGLPLCATHHRAFDRDLLRITERGTWFAADDGPSLDDLRVTKSDLHHLNARPHSRSIEWRAKSYEDQ